MPEEEFLPLEAVCVGYAVPRRDFLAEVHSAFTSAANLRLTHGGRLITLVAFQEADLPQGIRLNTPAQFSFSGLARGAAVACRDGFLRCQGSPLVADLRRAKRWKCNLAALELTLNAPALRAAWECAAELFAAQKRRGQAEPAVAGVEIERLATTLTAAAKDLDAGGAGSAAAGLVGLGPGLTPAGDDFLVGFLAGLWSSAGGNAGRLHFLAGLGRKVDRLSGRTNDISREYLRHAARGQVSGRLNALAEAIGRAESPDRLREVTAASLEVGHLSGLAATGGLLLGLAAWA